MRIRKKGHTLIESIMVIVLVSVISFVFALYIQEGFNAWQFLSGQKGIALSSRAALNRMVREIKKADPDEIVDWSDHHFSFEDISDPPISISYQQVGTDLMYNENDILLSNLEPGTGLQFTYLDENGIPPPAPQSIRVVICRLTVVRDDNRFVIESAARLRKRTL